MTTIEPSPQLPPRKHGIEYHAKVLSAKGKIRCWLANTIRGQSLHPYISCILPKILYPCPAWMGTGNQYQIRPFEVVQLRAHMCCLQSTPIHALEIEASIPPSISKLIKKCAIRFNKFTSSMPNIPENEPRSQSRSTRSSRNRI